MTNLIKKHYVWYRTFFSFLLITLLAHQGAGKEKKTSTDINSFDTAMIDSLFQIGQSLVYSNPDSARSYFGPGLTKAVEIKSELWETIMLNALGVSYLIQADYRNASDYLFQSLRIAINLDNPTRIARTYNNLGILSKELGSHKDALTYYLQALDLYEKSGDEYNRGNVLNNINVLYTDINNYEKAIEYSDLAYQSFAKSNDSIGMNGALSSKGALYMKVNQFDSSFYYLNRAIEIAIKSGNNYGLSNSYRNLANIYLAREEIDKAIQYFQMSKDLSVKINVRNNEAYADLGLADVYLHQENYSESLQYAGFAMEIATEMDNIKILTNVHRKLSEIYAGMGSYEKAFNHYKTSRELNDQLTDQHNLHQIYNLEIEKLNENMKITKLEVQRQELLIGKRNSVILLIILAFLITFSLLLLFYTRFRHKQKVKLNEATLKLSEERSHAALEAELQERRRLGLELHDGVGPLLSVAKLNVTALLQKPNISSDRKISILENTLETLNEVLKEMKHISHNMAPIVLIEQGFEAAIKSLVTKLNETEKYQVSLNIYGLNGSLEPYIEHALYRSILEILNNTLMHAGGSEITIQIIQTKEDITIMIEDNGQGFDVESINKNKGLGLKSTTSRVESLKGNLFIDSAIGKGTTVTMIIPLIKSYEARIN